jgi:uncharacterized protein YjbI with pentapeptide repeats
MTPDVTTLPISPQTFWIVAGLTGVVLLTALVFWALKSMERDHRPPLWEDLPQRGQGITVFLGLLWIGLFGLTIVAAYLGVWEAIHPKDASSQPNLGLGALLAALLGSPFVIWGTWLKYQTVRFQKEGHMTDRINTAVEQLGAEKTVKVPGKDADGKDITIEETRPNIEVRIGAILSLERIAQDSTIHDKGRDHVRVMEILCAYVRENAKAVTLEPRTEEAPVPEPRLDIKIAVDVLKRRNLQQLSIEEDVKYRLDLRAVDFGGVDFSKGNMSGTVFAHCRFEFANFEDADLRGALFFGSLINFAWWRGADITGATFDNCILNRPEKLAGRSSWRTPTLAKVKGVSVVSADLSAMDYFGEDPDAYFGSRDTKLQYSEDVARKDAIDQGREISRLERSNAAGAASELSEALQKNPFRDWAPYDGNDLAIGHLKSKWREKLGLTSWPYVD